MIDWLSMLILDETHLSTPSLTWWFDGRTPPSFSHSISTWDPPLAAQVNSTALPKAFTSTCGDTFTDRGAVGHRGQRSNWMLVRIPLMITLWVWRNARCMHETELSVLTSDRDSGQRFTLANFVAGNTLVCPSIALLGQVDLEVSSLLLSSRRQAAIDLSPLKTQGRSAMGQTLQSDYFTHSHGHVIGQGSGIGWGCSNQRNVS